MSDFKIMQEILSEQKATAVVEESYNTLSHEEVVRMVGFIRETLRNENQEENEDVVREMAYNMIEDVPGLEHSEDQHVAVEKIVKEYFKK